MGGKGKTLDEQIGDMLEDISAPDKEVSEEEETTEELEVEEEIEDIVEEEPEEVEEPEELDPEPEPEPEPEAEEVEEGDEPEEEEEEEEEISDPDPSDELVDFRDRLNKIAEAALKGGAKLPADLLGIEETPVVAPVVTPQVVETPTVPASYDDFSVIMDGVKFDDFMDSEEQFVRGMRDILSRHEQLLSQRFMTTVPGIVQNQVTQITSLQRATDEFYENNEDLKAVRPTVGVVANQIHDSHPDWSLDRIMEESAKSTRKLLKLPIPNESKKDKKTVKKKKVNPSFAKSKGSSQRNKPKPTLSKMQKEIDDLL